VIYRFQVHVLIESGIAYTCVTYLTRKHYVQFAFLEALKEKFIEIPSLRSRAVAASENEFDRDFCPVMTSVVVSTVIVSIQHIYARIVTTSNYKDRVGCYRHLSGKKVANHV
jgi:hypothetical protein